MNSSAMQKHIKIMTQKSKMMSYHTLMTEVVVRKGSTKWKKVSVSTNDTIITNLGGDDIKSTSCKYKDAKI